MKRRDFLSSSLFLASGLSVLPGIRARAEDLTTPSVNLDLIAPPPAVEFLTPEMPAFAGAKEIANAGLTFQPAVIARCTTEAGVAEAIRHAAEHNLSIAVKSGGHSFEGFCLNNGGLVIDISALKQRTLNRETFEFTAGPGCRLMEINDYLLPKGRLLPAGSCGNVGLSGLTLGGGYGFFSRAFGLTCDHLSGVRIIDAQGAIHDSRDEPELLWACRGGGNGHFGVVSEMRFRTQPAPETMTSFRFRAHKLEPQDSFAIAEKWFAAMPGLPEAAFSAFVLSGRSAFILVMTHGDPADAALQPKLAEIGSFMQKAEDPITRPLEDALPRYYAEMHPTFFKNASAGFYKDFEDLRPAMAAIIDVLVAQPGVIFQVNTMGGAIARGEESAYAHRALPFLGEWQSYWEKAAQAAPRLAAVGKIRDLLAGAGIKNHYANYPDTAMQDWANAYYGPEIYTRLQAIKTQLDPQNRFQHPQSVRA